MGRISLLQGIFPTQGLNPGLVTWYFSPISHVCSPDSRFRAGKRKKNSHLRWLQVCLSGATCTCCYFRKKEASRPHKGPQSNMVIKSLGSWRQSIFLLRFQSPIVKDTKKRAAWQNNDLIGVTTLVPQTNLPETPLYSESETLKAKTKGFQEDLMGWFQKEGLLFLPGYFQW